MDALGLKNRGWAILREVLSPRICDELARSVFAFVTAGQRCLLDHPAVADAAKLARQHLVTAGVLSPAASAIQAIAFDKTATTNWKVTWHQDLMFPFAEPQQAEGFEHNTIKDGVPFARPPLNILQALLAVRLHLDDCTEENGPLRVSSGTHECGIIASREIATLVAQHGETTCLAPRGAAVLMRPLTLHASSSALKPRHRRVLHLVYFDDSEQKVSWHRQV